MEMEVCKPQPTRRIFPSAVLTELWPRIVDHRAHHLFDETPPRTADVLDRSTRATGQPPATSRREVRADPRAAPGGHASVLCRLPCGHGDDTGGRVVCVPTDQCRVRIRNHPLFFRTKQPSVQCSRLLPTFFLKPFWCPLDVGYFPSISLLDWSLT